MVKRWCLGFVCLLLIGLQVQAVVPAGYYDGSDGLTGSALKTKMYNLVKNHTVLSYAALWTAFQTTDKRADGKVWDIYSNATNFVYVTNQDAGSGGTSEGQFYNREHSFPNSWFGGDAASAMYTDLFHMYPADKWVNNKRGNMPFGNVQTVLGYSANHYCEWGTSTESGSSLNVFEPADELKGDLARSYFYMVTCYENVVSNWTAYSNTEMLGGNSYPGFSSWGLKVLLDWSRLDPVSDKERARNEAIYTNFQHNRNPFIDFPSLAEYVWGDSATFEFHASKYLAVTLKKKETQTFTAWSVNGNLHVSTIIGKSIEIRDVTGIVLFHLIADQVETTVHVGMNRFIMVQVDSQVQKIVL